MFAQFAQAFLDEILPRAAGIFLVIFYWGAILGMITKCAMPIVAWGWNACWNAWKNFNEFLAVDSPHDAPVKH